MKIVSVILARGGSKGIPKKNITELQGFPLIWYTINASQKSKVHETWVSTDDDEIAKIAIEAGALVLKRPPNLATDTSQSEESLLHFADNVDFDILVFIQPTSPLLCHYHINQGLDMMDNHSSVFSAYKEHWQPRWTKENILGIEVSHPMEWNPNQRPRRQDAEETYVENGAFYITTRESLLKSKLRYSGKMGILEMTQQESFQIDTYNDLELIKKLL
jgi:N-acylneuraminate cytidylyltransferase